MMSAGLMQHYGWPTEFIDATKSLRTAAFFARCGALENMGEGALAVFDVATLIKNAVIVDLAEHRAAVRPRWQDAYGIWHSEYRDLKQQEAIQQMGITWYAFRTDPSHCARVAKGTELLSVLEDEAAGLLRLWIDGAVEQHGKVSHPVAKYLAERIAQCPVITRRTGDELRTIRPSEGMIAVDEQQEIETSLKLWSRDHLDFVKR